MKPLLFVALVCFSLPIFAQTQTAATKTPPTGFGITPTRLLVHELKPGDALTTFDLRETTPDGSPRYFDTYLPGDITLRDGSVLKGFTLDYNIKKWTIEVFHNGDYYDVPGFMVRELTIIPFLEESDVFEPIRLVNPNEFLNLPDNATLFLELAPDKELQPYTAYPGASIKTIPANYVVALDTGSKQPTLRKENKLYFYDGSQLREIPDGKKAARKFFLKEYPESGPFLDKKMDYNDLENVQGLLDRLR